MQSHLIGNQYVIYFALTCLCYRACCCCCWLRDTTTVATGSWARGSSAIISSFHFIIAHSLWLVVQVKPSYLVRCKRSGWSKLLLLHGNNNLRSQWARVIRDWLWSSEKLGLKRQSKKPVWSASRQNYKTRAKINRIIHACLCWRFHTCQSTCQPVCLLICLQPEELILKPTNLVNLIGNYDPSLLPTPTLWESRSTGTQVSKQQVNNIL